MAKSPSHKFGQIIGEVLETSVEPMLRALAIKHRLYLDTKGKRPARKGRKKIAWIDLYGNSHDLDFVFERGGTDQVNGRPVAFIEAAWRRYTKHSRNKAQEIQGAIMPLHATHWDCAPFIGVILAGEYTEGSLAQLRNLGFKILHFTYDKVIKVFDKYSIDASSDEDTPDEEFAKKVKSYEALTPELRKKLAADLAKSSAKAVHEFTMALEQSITRTIQLVRILPLHGTATELGTVEEAIEFISSYSEATAAASFVKYEIEIRFSNGDKIQAEFRKKERAVGFLRGYEAPFRPAG